LLNAKRFSFTHPIECLRSDYSANGRRNIFLFALIAMALIAQPLRASELQQFIADYEIFYGDIRLGKANYRFSHTQDENYRFDFVSDLRFLIFSDDRVVSTELSYEDSHLLPSYYSHDRKGTGRDYLEEIRFDRSDNLIRSTYGKESQEFAWERGVVDGLTVQLQLMLDLQRGIKRPKYKILDVNRIREREFSFVGEETIMLVNEDYHSVIYQVVRDNNRRKTQIWFSPERNYLPVQMVHYSKGKKRFNAHLVKYREFDGAEAPEQ